MNPRERRLYKIWQTLISACDEGRVPDGHYGPETCRWASAAETKALGLDSVPLVHIAEDGRIDCAITETDVIPVENPPQ
jgi:hypothetical protein